MKFKMPVFNELQTRITKLDVDYVKPNNTRPQQSFYPSPYKTTPKDRHEDIYFIQSIAQDVVKIKFEYDHLDDAFKDKDYASETAPFLKNAISGAAILILTSINDEFFHETSMKGNNILASRIMTLYEIDKLSDIPREKKIECFEALKQYITTRNLKTWHAEKSNSVLIKELDTAITNIQAHTNIFVSRVS